MLEIVQDSKDTIISQIKEIQQEISDAEALLSFQVGDKEVLNEEGLPIKDIREDIGNDDEEEGRRVVVAEEVPSSKIYTMEEIDRMMDEAEEEEKSELETLQRKNNSKVAVQDEEEVTAIAGQGLEVGQISGEELLAKLVDDSKNRYNPIDGTWIENNDEEYTDDDGGFHPEDDDEEDDEQEEEEEEDEYGRTRGYLIPPYLSRGIQPEKGVKFASFEKPATPSTGPSEKPIKSVLKKSTIPPTIPSSSSAVPAKSTSTTPIMSTTVVERAPKKEVFHSLYSLLIEGYP